MFELAKGYEKIDPASGLRYTWNQSESLEELDRPGRIAEIKAKHEEQRRSASRRKSGQTLYQILAAALDDEDDDQSCVVCQY